MGFIGYSKGAQMVLRPGATPQDCIKACLEEEDIDCRYYKLRKNKRYCLLLQDKEPSIEGLIEVEKPEPAPAKKPASSWISQLQARIMALEQRNIDTKNIHKEISDLKTELTALKNSRALTHHLLRTSKEQNEKNIGAIDNKVEVLKAESKRVEDAVMTLGELQKTLGNKIRTATESQRAMELNMASISQSSKDTRASVRELATKSTEFKRSLGDIKKAVTELEVRFAGLTTDVMEKVSSLDTLIGPELREMRESQTGLAQALSMLTNKIMLLVPRIPEIQKKLSKEEGVIGILQKSAKSLHQEIAFINERLSFTEGQLRQVTDPGSKLNIQRRAQLNGINSQLKILSSEQRKLRKDVLAETNDRNQLYKKISGLIVSRQAMVDKVIEMEEQMRAMTKTIRQLAVEGPKGQLVTNILKRQVAALKSLKVLHLTQTEVQNALQKYKLNILKTNRRLMQKDRIRAQEENALKQLQERLVSLYKTVKAKIDKTAPDGALESLLEQQQMTLDRIEDMTRHQAILKNEIAMYKKTSSESAKKILEQEKQQKEDLLQMSEMRAKLAHLYTSFRQKLYDLENMKVQDHEETVKELKEIMVSQRKVLQNLDKYKHDLNITRQELEKEKANQKQADLNYFHIHRELNWLRSIISKLQLEKSMSVNTALAGSKSKEFESRLTDLIKYLELHAQNIDSEALKEKLQELKSRLNHLELHATDLKGSDTEPHLDFSNELDREPDLHLEDLLDHDEETTKEMERKLKDAHHSAQKAIAVQNEAKLRELQSRLHHSQALKDVQHKISDLYRHSKHASTKSSNRENLHNLRHTLRALKESARKKNIENAKRKLKDVQNQIELEYADIK